MSELGEPALTHEQGHGPITVTTWQGALSVN